MPCSIAPLPPGAHYECNRGEQHVHEQYRGRIAQSLADRQVIEQAAAELRAGAIRAGYAGAEGKHVAFALALVLDELARHVRELRPELRTQVLHGARMLLGGQ